MKRWLLVPVVFLGACVGLAHADYVVIIADLGQTKDSKDSTAGGQPGARPGAFPGGFPGAPGAAPGAAPGGAPPNLPPRFPGGGFPGSGGPPGGFAGSGSPPGGFPGAGRPGGFPPSGFTGGAPGMTTGAGMGRGTNPGKGMPGMMGSGGMTTGMGMGGRPGGFYGGQAGASLSDALPYYVLAIVEDQPDSERNKQYKEKQLEDKDQPIYIRHKWNGKCIVRKETEVTRALLIHKKTVTEVYLERLEKLKKNESATAADWIEQADFSLEHGLLHGFANAMDKAAELDKNNPRVKNYLAIKEAINAPVKGGNELVDAWSPKLHGRFLKTSSEHYWLIHDSKFSSDSPEVKSRLESLEKNFKAFYYWFAMQGKILPMPEKRLIAVLTADKKDIEKAHQFFESDLMVADGFVASHANVAFFSLERLDAPAEALVQYNQEKWNHYDRDKALKGDVKLKDSKTNKPPDREELSIVQTLALLQKALEEDGERATVSHEGTRQLIVAAGLAPSSVILPDWIQFGMGSFFETPKGAPWTSVGAPNWNYLPLYKKLETEKRLEKPIDALKKVITNEYWRLSLLSAGKTDPGIELKARTMSWAFTYYLAREKLDQLFKYYQELSQMPRDVELDDSMLLGAFARAFDMTVPGTNKIDETKLGVLADEWAQYMTSVTLEDMDIRNEITKFLEQPEKKEGDKASGNPAQAKPGAGNAPPGGQ
jgi:hypothetical protein